MIAINTVKEERRPRTRGRRMPALQAPGVPRSRLLRRFSAPRIMATLLLTGLPSNGVLVEGDGMSPLATDGVDFGERNSCSREWLDARLCIADKVLPRSTKLMSIDLRQMATRIATSPRPSRTIA